MRNQRHSATLTRGGEGRPPILSFANQKTLILEKITLIVSIFGFNFLVFLQVPRNLPCPETFLVARLHSGIIVLITAQ